MISKRHRRKSRFLAAFLCATAPGILFFSAAGCVSPARDLPGRVAPPPGAAVSKSAAWRDAEALAALDPSRLTVIGSGESMKPVYGENTVLVLQRVSFDALAEGMNVAYRQESGRMVLHRLVAKEGPRSWRARGLNNEIEDRERVTPENLLGIVYAAFANDQVR